MPVKGEANKPAARRKYAASKEMSYRQAVISLAIGDILVFLIILVALPFIAGWFIVSPFMGMFRRDIFTQPRAMAFRTAAAWIPAWVIAMILRGIFFDHGVPGRAFMVIALLFNLALLEIWRWPFALNNAARKRGA